MHITQTLRNLPCPQEKKHFPTPMYSVYSIGIIIYGYYSVDMINTHLFVVQGGHSLKSVSIKSGDSAVLLVTNITLANTITRACLGARTSLGNVGRIHEIS